MLLIRHGDYVIYAPTAAEGKRLIPCGKTQANQTARTLVSAHIMLPVEKIVTSTMVRARETANIIDT